MKKKRTDKTTDEDWIVHSAPTKLDQRADHSLQRRRPRSSWRPIHEPDKGIVPKTAKKVDDESNNKKLVNGQSIRTTLQVGFLFFRAVRRNRGQQEWWQS